MKKRAGELPEERSSPEAVSFTRSAIRPTLDSAQPNQRGMWTGLLNLFVAKCPGYRTAHRYRRLQMAVKGTKNV